jgi:deazaflavin-dependent oxidoreductase (nitroreductase family)
MRVEHNGAYAMVASQGGAPNHPSWYHNLKAYPDQLTVQDGPEPFDAVAREWRVRSVRSGGTGPSRPTRRMRSTSSGPSG